MVPVNFKVLAKFGLCLNCSQTLHGRSLARARKIFATARMLAFSLTCDRLFEISLSCFALIFHTYINDQLVMIWLKQKVETSQVTSGFSLSSTVSL